MKKQVEKEEASVSEAPVIDVLANKLASAARLVEEKLLQMGVDLTGKAIIIRDGKVTVE